jgi:hypothetical protein
MWLVLSAPFVIVNTGAGRFVNYDTRKGTMPQEIVIQYEGILGEKTRRRRAKI